MIRKMAPIGVAMLLASAAMPAQASDATQSTFGTLPDGRAVPAVMLSNANGVSATVIAYGATLQSVILPDKDGNKADVALGYANLQRTEERRLGKECVSTLRSRGSPYQ